MSYLYQAPAGVIGDISRPDHSSVEPSQLITPFPTAFGVPMKNVAGGSTQMVAADGAALFAGVLARSAPGISGSKNDEAVNTFVPNSTEINGICTRGYVSVFCNAGTPVRGAAVFIVQTVSAGHTIGQFETTANAGANIALTGTLVGNVTWASDGVDANGNAEIRIAQ